MADFEDHIEFRRHLLYNIPKGLILERVRFHGSVHAVRIKGRWACGLGTLSVCACL